MKAKIRIALLILGVIVLVISGCAANNTMYNESPAGFWAGLWHGLIIFITFIISLFTDNVTIYEVSNTGSWYNLGFVLGCMISLGGHGHASHKIKKSCKKEKEWEEIGEKVEEKVRKGIGKWIAEEEGNESDWQEIGKKVEEKIKRELRNWAEKE